MKSKRFVTLVLAAMLVFLLLPAAALAGPPPGAVCQRYTFGGGEIFYNSLDDALAADSPFPIYLLTDITYTGDIVKPISFFTYPYTLTINGNVSVSTYGRYGLSVTAGAVIVNGSVTVVNSGYSCTGVYAAESTVTINGDVTVNGACRYGVFASAKSMVTIHGDINVSSARSTGVYAEEKKSTVMITGNVSAEGDESIGVQAWDGGTAIITGNVSTQGDKAKGVSASSYDAAVTINGSVTAKGSSCAAVSTFANGAATIIGNVSAEGDESTGVCAQSDGTATITGNVAATGSDCAGVYTYDGGSAVVRGGVRGEGYSAAGVYTEGGNATVTGDVAAAGDYCAGVFTWGGASTINGNVSANGNPIDSDKRARGVYIRGGTATVNGNITAMGKGILGVYAISGDDPNPESTVAISGNITVTDNVSAGAEGLFSGSAGIMAGGGSKVTIGGSIQATGPASVGASASQPGSLAIVKGSVWVMGTQGVGALGTHGGIVRIDGIISALNYACVAIRPPNHLIKAQSKGTPATGEYVDYLVYTATEEDDLSKTNPGFVYVKIYVPSGYTENGRGVVVSGNISQGAALSVTELHLHGAGSCAACDAIREGQAGAGLIWSGDISLSSGYNGQLTVTIPVGARCNGQAVTILHCVNGATYTYTALVQDGKITFYVNSLSPFAVFLSAPALAPPKTGGAAFPTAALPLSLALLSSGGLYLRRREGRKG